MTDLQFIITFFIAAIGITGPIIVLLIWSIVARRKILTNKEAVVVWTLLIIWYALFFTQCDKIIPESWKPIATQQMVCEMKTVYVPRK